MNFSLWCWSQISSQDVYYWTLTPFHLEKFQPKPSLPVWMFHVIEKVCVLTSIVVARLQSSGLRLKHENIASIKTTHATKHLWIDFHEFVTCICHGTNICNMYMSWKTFLNTFMTVKSLFVLSMVWIPILMAFASDIIRRKSLI